jgi:hypothetical protein
MPLAPPLAPPLARRYDPGLDTQTGGLRRPFVPVG